MGFAGTLASGWCDWVIADKIVIPPETVACEVWRNRISAGRADGSTAFEGELDPEEDGNDWVYTEKMAYVPTTYFVTDHKQGFRDETPSATAVSSSRWVDEEARRWRLRRELFPQLTDNTVILCCLNQLYKVCKSACLLWSR